ncbi:MAG: rod shape-determining protein [Patescibacteria group bacterium]|nr:rod shape-determining protein [Candidatus Beckwithbacteria bacterium]MDZ4229090.1 rod shape-determining protein [Patescibacteria group bacterium]
MVKKIGIDLGTANTIVYVAGSGIVLQEPTVVAVSLNDNRVVAVGGEAKDMLGRTPETIVASRPMRDGVIADYVITEAMLRYFIQKVSGKYWFFRPEVMICVPAGCTQVEKRAVEAATRSAGAKEVYIIQEPFAAALGAGIAVGEASGNMIVDMGGGSSEAAVISLGGVVVSKSIRVSGNSLDDAIAVYLKKKHGLIIGEQTAEQLKINFGQAMALAADDQSKTVTIKGRDTIQGLPRSVEIKATELEAAMRPKLAQIVNMVKSVLEEVPPELASDIIDKGIVLSGGTALLKNFDRLLTESTGVPCHVAEEPLLCVAKGTGMALENLDLYKLALAK